MSADTYKKYKTFDQLMASVRDDLHGYELESMIQPSQLIKVVTRINKELGIRITTTKEKILDVNNGLARLPDDFNVFNFGLVLGFFSTIVPKTQGTHRTEKACGTDITLNQNTSVVIDEFTVGLQCGDINNPPTTCTDTTVCPVPNNNTTKPCGLDSVCANSVQLNDCGQSFEVIETKQFETRHYNQLYRLELVDTNCLKHFSPHFYFDHGLCTYKGKISEGHLQLTLKHGHVYINYEGLLQDEEGNLLVIDHPMINEYYEYAIKLRIMENLIINGDDANVTNVFKLLEERKREAKNAAYNVVNMPDFKDVKDTLEFNRRALFKRYYSIFLP